MPDETARHGPGHHGTSGGSGTSGGPGTPGGSGTSGTSGGSGGEGSETGRAAVPADDPLARLVLRLRESGLDPDAEQLCDALWLARWTRSADATDAEPAPDARVAPAVVRPPTGPVSLPSDRARPPAPEPPAAPAARRVALYPLPPATGPVRTEPARPALPVGVPAAPCCPRRSNSSAPCAPCRDTAVRPHPCGPSSTRSPPRR